MQEHKEEGAAAGEPPPSLLLRQVNPGRVEGAVFLVFSDGELSVTRSGPLFGQREMHRELLPVPLGTTGRGVTLPRRWAGLPDVTYAAFTGREEALALCEHVRRSRLGPPRPGGM